MQLVKKLYKKISKEPKSLCEGRISRLDVESLSRLNLHTASKLQFSQQPPTVSEPCSLDVVVEGLRLYIRTMYIYTKITIGSQQITVSPKGKEVL